MSRSGSIRRLAVGGAFACVAFGAAPALAGASPCTYNPTTKVASVVDSSGVKQLLVGVNGDVIFTQDGGNPPISCVGGGSVATTANTDRVSVFAQANGASDGVQLDESKGAFAPGATPEADGNSEIELALSGKSGHLSVFGTPGDDVIRVRPLDRVSTIAAIGFGADEDDDVTFNASDVALVGGDGADLLSGQGYGPIADPARLPLSFSGGAGDDDIRGGLGVDHFAGNAGNDSLQTADGNPELVSGGPDVDSAVRDGGDTLFNVESATFGSVGRLALSPRTVTTDASKQARMTLRWTHPKTWRDLRRLELRLYRGAERVGTIDVRPRDARLVARGAVQIMADTARVTHTGKTLTARLGMRFPSSLAGASLRLAVEATDLHGHKQLERDAGRIRVAK
jgi:Ca2+-binding RTX toxin-like protein